MKSSSSTTTSRGTRERFPVEQVNRLEELFAQTHAPTTLAKEQLAEELGTTKRRIQVWFQNRRSKSKRRLATTAVDNPPPPISPAPGPSHQQGLHRQGQIIKNPSSSLTLNASPYPPTTLNAYNITDTTPSFIHPRYSHSELAQTIVYQPTYSIDAAVAGPSYEHHHRYYTQPLYAPHKTERFQHPPIIRAVPPPPSTQHQPLSHPLPQGTIPSVPMHEGSSFSVTPNPGSTYLLSHETQHTPQLHRYHYHQHRHHYYHHQQDQDQDQPSEVSILWSGKKSS